MAARLRDILALAKKTDHLRRVFVWGSFPTAKLEPGDVDIMLVMSADFRSEQCTPEIRQVFDGEAAERILGATILWMADRSRGRAPRPRGGDHVMTSDSELIAAQARVQVIQAMLAHARRTCTPESFRDQAKGWLAEWQRLDDDIRGYLSTPPARAAG